MAKILGISGSPRNKSTEYALGEALKSIESVSYTHLLTMTGRCISVSEKSWGPSSESLCQKNIWQ